jgi:hypothetical protein
MTNKSIKILLIASNTREDLINYLLEVDFFDITILSSEETNVNLNAKQIQYKDFSHPKNILKKIAPDVLLFQSLYDILDVSLCIVANKLKYRTIFLEHGIKENISYYVPFSKKESNIIKKINTIKLNTFGSALKNRLFYLSALFYTNTFISIYSLIKFFIYSELKGYMIAHIKTKMVEKLPKKYLLFGLNNTSHINGLYHILNFKDIKCIYTGNPYITKYELKTSDKITIIDHPYFEFNYYDWTESFHLAYIKKLYSFIEYKSTFDFLIKLHPKSNEALWYKIPKPKNALIIQSGEQKTNQNYYQESKLILSYSSSLLVDFICNQKNIVLLGWHPKPKINGVDFSKYGICHTSFSMNDLDEKWEYWLENNLSRINDKGYEDFLKEFNAPFDGLAKQRIINEILND